MSTYSTAVGSMVANKEERRRRSSSIISHVQPETIEEQIDQAALPNLNANWVHNKGIIFLF